MGGHIGHIINSHTITHTDTLIPQLVDFSRLVEGNAFYVHYGGGLPVYVLRTLA